jgi:hypothetical protein
MDVATRWDSTVLMLIRAMRLRNAIDKFCEDYRIAHPFQILSVEWDQIGYLIDLLRPFNFFTTTIGKTKSITLPYALRIYDELYERLNESRRRLKAKVNRKPWVRVLLEGIDAAEAKLDQYYNKMYTDLGSIYAIGAILNPSLKSETFNPDYCWLDFNVKDWQFEFKEQFQELFQKNYRDRAGNSQRLQTLRELNMDAIALALDRDRLSSVDIADDEVDTWLRMSKLFYTNLYTNR